MPLLLRRSAPSPSIDQLSLSSRVPSLTSSLSSASESSQSQRCLVHTNSRVSMRRRSLNSTDTDGSFEDNQDIEASETASVDNDAGEQAARGSGTCTCIRSRRSQGSSKRMSTRLEDLAPLDDATCPEQEHDTDELDSICSHDRESTCVKCEGVRDSVSSNASSRIVIRETQLAALDAELQNLRKSFTKSVYAKLSNLSRRLGKRNDTKHITAA